MMSFDNHIWLLAEAAVAGTLSKEEQDNLDQRLQADPEFAAEFQESYHLVASLQANGRTKKMQAMLGDIQQQLSTEATPANPAPRTIPMRAHYWRTAAVAAGIALLTSMSTAWLVQHKNERNNPHYRTLAREIATIKTIQVQQSATLNKIKDSLKQPVPLPPVAPVNASGTGFGLTNDGYLVTNYHVTRGADSIYIQTREGRYHKAFMVAYDEVSDLAVLKVMDGGFRFGKNDLPYTLAGIKSSLGARVYSLGFPQDEIVYNEGYISARNGYHSDSNQYQLELPSYPGQSGAPVIDATGNIVAFITANAPESAGTTYAVSSKALLQLLRTLPEETDIRLPKTNRMARLSREQQIEKLQDYTCVVKVYR